MPSRSEWQRRFYNSPAWKKKRAYILMRDHYLCQEHLRRGTQVAASVVHHITALEAKPHMGMTDANLESLCAACHEGKHNRKEKHSQVGHGGGVRIIKA